MKRILWNHRERPGQRGDIDEIVVQGCDLHIEQMGDQCWWVGITLPDGTYWMGNLHTNDDGTMSFTEQEGDIAWDRNESHER